MEPLKKLKLFISLLLLALAISLYFNFNNSEPSDPVEEKETLCVDFSTDNPSTLSTGLVADLTKNYRENQLVEINKIMDSTDSDAHSIWFDLDTIKKFIYHIEKNVKKHSSGTDKLGLRMYYAAYPNRSEFIKPGNEDLADLEGNIVTQKYGFKHTLVMIPTIHNNTINGEVDFNPLDSTTYKGYISMPKKTEVENADELKAAYELAGYKPMALMPNSRVSSRNHGSLIPPATTTVEGF